MGMNDAVTELVGIAASVAGHCRPCLLYHLRRAKELGIAREDIEDAIGLARDIGRSGDEDMHRFALATLRRSSEPGGKGRGARGDRDRA
jgi:AhpD family alkylhydroperoxidase